MKRVGVHTFVLMLFRFSFYLEVLMVLSAIASCQKATENALDVYARQKLKDPPEYSKALNDALVNVPYARDFKKSFPLSRESFSSFTGKRGQPTLICMAGLYGRYVLRVDVEVTFDSSRTKVISYGDPIFCLVEVIGISALPDGRVAITSKSIKEFGEELWKAIVEHGGDFSSVGIELTKDDPVPGFDQHWWEV